MGQNAAYATLLKLAKVTVLGNRLPLPRHGGSEGSADDSESDIRQGTTCQHLWRTLLKCRALRVLQLGAVYFDMQGDRIQEIAVRLPSLEELWACDMSYRAYREPLNAIPGLYTQRRLPAFYYFARSPVDPAGYPLDMCVVDAKQKSHEEYLNQRSRMTAGVRWIVSQGLEIKRASSASIHPALMGLIPEGVDRENVGFPYVDIERLRRTLDIEYVKVTHMDNQLQLFGLPISSEELVYNAKLRELNKGLKKDGYKEFPEAMILRRFWRRVEWRRRLRLFGALSFASIYIAACEVLMTPVLRSGSIWLTLVCQLGRLILDLWLLYMFVRNFIPPYSARASSRTRALMLAIMQTLAVCSMIGGHVIDAGTVSTIDMWVVRASWKLFSLVASPATPSWMVTFVWAPLTAVFYNSLYWLISCSRWVKRFLAWTGIF